MDTAQQAILEIRKQVEANKLYSSTDYPPLPDKRLYEVARELTIDWLRCGGSNIKIRLFRELERALYDGAMKHCHGNQSRAAAAIGVNRGTFRKWAK